jgi:tRNA (guanine37-N1)-methyltransferase
MRKISFITIHPKIIDGYRQFGVFKSAEVAGLAQIGVADLRDFAADKHGSVDAAPYGGGDGMVMRVDCLSEALESVRANFLAGRKGKVIFTSPGGKLWSHEDARAVAAEEEPLIFVCGRFAGVDQRFIDAYVDREYSIGDVVLAGGELPAMMIAESILRLVPGVLGDERSAVEDSFGDGLDGLLEYPSYTRPQDWKGQKVPDVLMSGNHQAIRKWRRSESLKKTQKIRPDLIQRSTEID